MQSGAERQRQRRARLRRQGIVDLTVSVPTDKRVFVRNLVKSLRDGSAVSVSGNGAGGGRLFAAIHALKSVRPVLQQAGVRRAGIFGSTARSEALAGSDIDVLIDIDTDAMGDVVNYLKTVGTIREAIRAACPGVEVDVADHATLKSGMRERAERDVLYAF